MRLMIYVLRNKEVGWGHWYRALALADVAEARGHQVVLLSDYIEASYVTVWINSRLNAPYLAYALTKHMPDWLLYEVPWAPEPYLVQMAHDYNCKSAWLDAGPDDYRLNCDLLWVQDDPERVILGYNYRYAQYLPSTQWLVFGGAADKMGVVARFARLVREPAWLITDQQMTAAENQTLIQDPHGVFKLQRRARAACLAMGQTAWECAALGVPIYLFSPDHKHLTTALKMERLGYAHTWPQLGLPNEADFVEFLQTPFRPTGAPIRDGAEHLMDALEARLGV